MTSPSILFIASGKYCATAGADCTVRLWNPARLDPAFPPPPRPFSCHLGGASPAMDKVPPRLLPQALPVQTYRDGMAHPVSALAIHDENSACLLAASDKTLVLYDVLSTKPLRRFQGQHFGRINAVAFGPSANTYMSASYDAMVKIWDGRSRSNEPIQTLKDAKDSVTDLHVVATSDHAVIRASSVDGHVRSYDLRMGVIRTDCMNSPVTGMSPTFDGLCLAISCLDGAIRLIELDNGDLLNTYSGSHTAGHFGLRCSLSSDDATIVSGSEDGSAILYDLVSATVVQKLQGHCRPVCAIATHPEHSSVVSTAGYDGQCIIWAHDSDYIGWQ
ncbi:hypothetical protein MPSEU_000514300 [Mayamaea pseudoterrestris]|nr:hypothetical protein MPSEU_000514300 [Mayamaea pseudoterrestris]